MLRSTSMLVPILASIDATRRQMVEDGEALWSRAVELAEEARGRLSAVPGLRCMDDGILARESVADLDRTRLTVSAADLGWAGYELEWELRERYHIAVETADSIGIVMNITYADTAELLQRLVWALTEIAARGPLTGEAHKTRAGLHLAPPPFARLAMTPRAAFFGETRALPLRECVGQVGAEVVTPYPPGVPVLGPGEEITADLVEYLAEVRRRGLAVHGPHDPTLATLRVVDRPLVET
jgi:arginine/lysine/ornithine decarboxylase